MKRITSVSLGLVLSVFFMYCNDQGASKEAATTPDSTTATTTPAASVIDDWKIGTQLWTFRKFTVAEALDKADSVGVKNIECYWGQHLGGGTKDSFGITMSDDSKAKLKEWLQKRGIQIVAMGVISPKSKEEWQKAFDLAKEFGLSYITSEPRKDMWNMIDSLAGAYGIKVAIHEHAKPNPYWHPDSVLAAIKGHSNIGACADIGHWARSGLDPVFCLQKLEGHVLGVHLKDIVKFNDPKARDTPVTRGVINYPAVFAELKRQNFKGMFSVEQESNWYHSVPDVANTVQYFKVETGKLR